jgi:hypothetical protein
MKTAGYQRPIFLYIQVSGRDMPWIVPERPDRGVTYARIVPAPSPRRLWVDGGAPPVDDGAVRRGTSISVAVLAAALLAAALVCSSAVAAPGKLIDKGSDDGFPIAYATAFVKNPKTLKVRVKGTPSQPIEVLWQVTCRKGGKKAKVPSGDFQLTPTKTKKLKKGTKRPDDCTIDVQAAYVTADVSGKITVELFATKQR